MLTFGLTPTTLHLQRMCVRPAFFFCYQSMQRQHTTTSCINMGIFNHQGSDYIEADPFSSAIESNNLEFGIFLVNVDSRFSNKLGGLALRGRMIETPDCIRCSGMQEANVDADYIVSAGGGWSKGA